MLSTKSTQTILKTLKNELQEDIRLNLANNKVVLLTFICV